MRFCTISALLILAALLPASANTILGVGANNHIYTVVPTTGVVTDLGTLPSPAANSYGDIAWDPVNGNVYVISFDGTGVQNSVLYRVILANPAAATIVGTNTGVKGLNSLVVNSAGTIYSVGSVAGNQLYTIDPTTGIAALVGPAAGGTYKADGDLEFDNSGNLYLSSFNTNPDTLFTINPATGVGTPLPGNTGFTNIFGLAYDHVNGVMYGFTNPGSAPGEVITINLTTGVGTPLVAYNAVFNGATDLEPEPGTISLLALGTIMLLGVAYRRRQRAH